MRINYNIELQAPKELDGDTPRIGNLKQERIIPPKFRESYYKKINVSKIVPRDAEGASNCKLP